MAYKKSFNRSERAALLALAELFKGGFISADLLNFQLMKLHEPEAVHFAGNSWINRYIDFHSTAGKVVVLVRTPTGQGYSPRHSDEHVEWRPDQADIFAGTGKGCHLTRRTEPVVHWSAS